MKYVSLFAGIGGFDLALNRLGHECVYANEWDKYAAQTYEKNFSNIKHTGTQNGNDRVKSDTTRSNGKGRGAYTYGNGSIDTRDITTVPTTDIPDHDLLVGGFPCQSFSIAGKRRGFAESRGTLFFEIARILKAKKPSFFILENVKGLLSHDNGTTFKVIISTLDELGYDLQWQVLNSKNFGVPQNRERVFIVGHLRGEPRPKVFPIGKDDTVSSEEREQRIQREVLGYRQKGDKPNDNSEVLENGKDGSLHYIGGIIGKRDKWLNDGKDNSRNFSQGQRVYGTDGISSTLAANAGGLGGKTGLYAMRWQRTEKGKQARRESQMKGRDYTPFSDGARELIPVPGKPVGALTSQAIAKDSLIGNEMKIRRLTPLECERLQGFPDNWTEGVSDTQRYKQLGNAVTVNVVYEVASNLVAQREYEK